MDIIIQYNLLKVQPLLFRGVLLLPTFLSSGQLITGSTSLIYKGSDGTARTINPASYQPAGSYAAASHNHSAANITSGTLAVARGGTGQTSVDTTPTSGSKKMCTSGGIYTALAGKQPAGSYAKPTDIPAALRGEYGTPLEMGKYIDFHTINSTADYDARLTCTNSWLSINEHRIVAVASWDGTNLYLT